MKSEVTAESAREGIKILRAEGRAFTLQGRRLFVFGLELQATDVFLLASLVFFSVLAILFNTSVPWAWRLALKNVIVGFVFIGFVYLYQQASGRVLKFIIRMTSVQLMFAYIFPSVLPLQLILSKDWNDAAVLNLEQVVFGVQPTVWVQKFISPALTEWMMFSYVIYLLLYPILCGILYFKRSERHMEDYLFTLGFANFLCVLGFILFPVAGPFYMIADRFTVPLKGYFFTLVGEFIRSNIHVIGGSLPSPHCAAATIMWVMAYRYHRTTFYILSPIILSIYISAFYLRYHYLSDVVFGILTAVATLLIVPFLMKLWNTWSDRQV
jgi:membrane-associated phospholipid phosphatase